MTMTVKHHSRRTLTHGQRERSGLPFAFEMVLEQRTRVRDHACPALEVAAQECRCVFADRATLVIHGSTTPTGHPNRDRP